MEGTSNDGSVRFNQPNNEAGSSNADPNSESVSGSRNKRSHLKHTWVPGRGGVAEAWVLMDTEGNTQQVYDHEVNILLGGQSVDTVLATIPSHPVRAPDLNSFLQCDTDLHLEPIIQESLLMLQRENIVGESQEPRRLSLERKAEHILMHFTRPPPVPTDFVQDAPSVHFLSIQPDRILLWRYSQDFDGGNANFSGPTFIYGGSRRSPYDHTSQESDDNPPMEINSESDTNDLCNSNQLKATKSSISLKKKGVRLLNKFLNKSKTDSCCSDPMESKRRGFVPHQHHNRLRGSISSVLLKLEEENVKNKELALNSERRLQEEVRAKRDLKRKLEQANQKEKNLNKFLAKEQEKRLINYTSSPIYDLLSNSQPESAANGRSIRVCEQTMNRLVREIADLKTTIFDSETLVKQSIVKYIADKRLERDMLQIIGSYSYTKKTGEQNIIGLAKALIEEQVEDMKQFRLTSESQEATLRKRNQLLEEENILLLKKIEKIQAKDVRNANDPLVPDDHFYQLKDISFYVKSNERLRDKISGCQARVEKLEVQLGVAQDKSDDFEKLLRSNKIEIENQKMLNGRLEADHELECSAIKSELAMKSQVLQHSLEVGEILIDDLNSLKAQLRESDSNVQIDWSRFQVRNGSDMLTSLLHMCRTCINEMGRELVSLQMKINQKNSATLIQSSKQETLKTALEESSQKNISLKAQLQQAITGKEKSDNKSEKLLQEIQRLQTSLCDAEKKNNNYATTLRELQDAKSALNRELNMLIEQQGDKFSENVHEMEKEMYKMSAENACLADKLQELKTENQKLLQSCHSFPTQTQGFQMELDMLVQENSALKMQHAADQNVLLCLGKQARLAGGGEDDCHTSAVTFIQTELVASQEKVHALERSIEIHNNKIKELEKELAEKDAYIKDSDVEFVQLGNSSQMEILALGREKEQMKIKILSLNRDNQEMIANISVLQKEIDAVSGKLCEKENQLERCALIERELLYQRREENSEMKGQLKDFNNIMNQRDKLIKNQEEFLIEAKNLHVVLGRREKKIASLTRKCAAKASEIGELKEKLQLRECFLNKTKGNTEIKLQSVQEELQSALSKLYEYEKHLNVVDYDIEQHSCKLSGELVIERRAKKILEEEVHHLKSVIDSHLTSLDQALKQIESLRKAEKELRNMLEDERRQRYDAEDVVKKLAKNMEESVCIVDQIDNEKERYRHLNNEYNQYKETVAKFKKDMETKVGVYQQELTTLRGERDALTKKIGEVEGQNHKLQENCKDLEKNLSELNLERSNYMEQIKSLLREMKNLGLTKHQVELTAREEKRSRENLELNHRELSAKLLEAVRMVIDEKMGRERIESQCLDYDSIIEKLLGEKKKQEEQILQLKETMQDLETRVKILSSDKQKFDTELKDAHINEKDLKMANERLRKRIAQIEWEMDGNPVSERLTDFDSEAQRASEESIRLREERFERLSNQLKETRDQLLTRRIEETSLRKKIVELQSERSLLSHQLRTLDRLKSEETQKNELLQKECQKFLEDFDAKASFSKSITTIRHLIRTGH